MLYINNQLLCEGISRCMRFAIHLLMFFSYTCLQIRSLEKKQKAGKYAKKVKAKTRRKMHEMENPLEVDEFADMWKE